MDNVDSYRIQRNRAKLAVTKLLDNLTTLDNELVRNLVRKALKKYLGFKILRI